MDMYNVKSSAVFGVITYGLQHEYFSSNYMLPSLITKVETVILMPTCESPKQTENTYGLTK
jgi:hypothetical protein